MGSRFARCLPLVVVALCLAAFACKPRQAETVTFLDGQFEALKPGSWSMRSDLNDAADLQMGNGLKEAYCTVLTEAKVDLDDDLSLQDFSDITRAFIRDSLDKMKESGPESLTIHGNSAIRYELSGTLDQTKVRYWHVALETAEHYHQVVLWSLPSRFAKNEADFTAVLNSIRPTNS